MPGYGLSSKDVKIQSTILSWLARPCCKCTTYLPEANDDDKQKLEIILAKFEAYCIPCAKITWERHRFNACNQQGNEIVDQYVTDLKKNSDMQIPGP